MLEAAQAAQVGGAEVVCGNRILKVKAITIPAKPEGTVVEVSLPAEAPIARPRSISDTPFAGMWKDREDMADSVEYINRLRREIHG